MAPTGVYSAFPVKEADADLLIMGNPRFVVSRRLNGVRLANYLECGQGPAGYHANTYRVEMELRSSILPAGEDGVRVSTYVGARARNVDGTSNTVVACASKLRLERELADRVAAIVGGGGATGPNANTHRFELEISSIVRLR